MINKLKHKDLREIIEGSGIAFVLKAAGAVLSFLLSLLLARKFGAEGAGAGCVEGTMGVFADPSGACVAHGLPH